MERSASNPLLHTDVDARSTVNLSRHLYPIIPPRKSSWQHGLKSSRSGNSLGGHIDARVRPESVENAKKSASTLASSSDISAEIESQLAQQLNDLSLSCAGDAPASPPAALISDPNASSSQPSKTADSLPFPLSPKPLVPSGLLATPKRRVVSAGGSPYPRSAPSTPDRFIPSRHHEDSLTKAFRLNKKPEDLSNDERYARTDGASPDPFTARRVTPIRRHSAREPEAPVRSRYPVGLRARVISPGSVWNVGGSASHQRPVIGVSDGRGGLLGSGTNAPMFSSMFFNTETAHESQERFEGRLALALDIDRSSRVVNIAQQQRLPPTPAAFPHRNHTAWSNGRWVTAKPVKAIKDATEKPRAVPSTPFRVLDAPCLRDDFYCTVLAYCPTLRVLAVGLRNRVYLWSESEGMFLYEMIQKVSVDALVGVRYPPRAEDNARDVYVTSLSFSSQLGGRSILAIGRSNGKVNLWSPHEAMDRIQHPLPRSIACVCFKPVPTRRYSDRQCTTTSTEELLIGDETGDVYYYSIEWTSRDSHGRDSTAMILLVKIDIHKQQICGIAWSPDGEYFATGGNDNVCLLFSVRDILEDTPSQIRSNLLLLPLTPPPTPPMNVLAPQFVPNETSHYTITQPRARSTFTVTEGRERHRWPHSAAVKAIAFCPWQRGLIATGGGSNDRAIHFFHTWSGACLATINVQAQVTSLIWSKTRREIAATFGYAQPEHPYRIAVFSWPDCKQVVSIPWSGDMRALYAIAYPGGPNETGKSRRESEGGRWWSRTAEEGCIVVASSDESVKFHEIWSGSGKGMGTKSGGLGWSNILESLEGVDGDWGEIIR